MRTQIRILTSDERGFTLVEIMTVCIIIGVLVAMGIPNFIQLQDRANEASVKANMHTIQLAIEDFGVQTMGIYPDDGTATTPGGQTVEDLCPNGAYPQNPFTQAATAVSWDADPANPGEIAVNPATTSDYTVKGHGKHVMLLLELHPGF